MLICVFASKVTMDISCRHNIHKNNVIYFFTYFTAYHINDFGKLSILSNMYKSSSLYTYICFLGKCPGLRLSSFQIEMIYYHIIISYENILLWPVLLNTFWHQLYKIRPLSTDTQYQNIFSKNRYLGRQTVLNFNENCFILCFIQNCYSNDLPMIFSKS